MIRLVTLFAALSLFTVAGAQAQSQRAPITRGATSGDLSTTVNDLRQRMATMGLDMARLEDEIGQLNGQVETLKFLLSQSRDESARMQEDDQRIGETLRSLAQQNERMEQQIAGLQEDIARLSAGDMGDTGTDSGDREVQTSSDARRAEPARTRQTSQRSDEDEDGSSQSVSDEANPNYQGSLGTLRASELPGEAGPLFAAAKSRLLKFDYAGAEEAFRAFLQRFSDDPQAGEAQYWLAETLFQQEAYAESGEAYLKMIREYPDDARAPDALVKLARSMRLVGDTDRACEALDVLPQQYPNASGVTRNLAALERTRAGCSA